MPSFLAYYEKFGKIPKCLAMSLAAYIAFYSNDIQELSDKGLVCKRPDGKTYVISDDKWALEFFYEHRNDAPDKLVHAVLANKQMWDQDLSQIAGLESFVIDGVKKIRSDGAENAFASML